MYAERLFLLQPSFHLRETSLSSALVTIAVFVNSTDGEKHTNGEGIGPTIIFSNFPRIIYKILNFSARIDKKTIVK